MAPPAPPAVSRRGRVPSRLLTWTAAAGCTESDLNGEKTVPAKLFGARESSCLLGAPADVGARAERRSSVKALTTEIRSFRVEISLLAVFGGTLYMNLYLL